jgi:hypothetical protein
MVFSEHCCEAWETMLVVVHHWCHGIFLAEISSVHTINVSLLAIYIYIYSKPLPSTKFSGKWRQCRNEWPRWKRGYLPCNNSGEYIMVRSNNIQPVRLAGGWWLVLVCSERRVLLAVCWWLVCCERKVLLPGGW